MEKLTLFPPPNTFSYNLSLLLLAYPIVQPTGPNLVKGNWICINQKDTYTHTSVIFCMLNDLEYICQVPWTKNMSVICRKNFTPCWPLPCKKESNDTSLANWLIYYRSVSHNKNLSDSEYKRAWVFSLDIIYGVYSLLASFLRIFFHSCVNC